MAADMEAPHLQLVMFRMAEAYENLARLLQTTAKQRTPELSGSSDEGYITKKLRSTCKLGRGTP